MSLTIRKCAWIEEGYGYDARGAAIIFNKIVRGAGRRVFARIAGSGARLYVFTRDRDLAQTAAVTDHVTWENPSHDRDWDDATAAYVSLPANTARTALRIYDIGAVSDVFLHLRWRGDGSDVRIYLAISTDGTTWTDIYTAQGNSAVSLFFKVKARYFKIDGSNSGTTPLGLYVYSFEIFDLTNYDQMIESTGSPVELEVTPVNQKVIVWRDCPQPCDWQVFTLRRTRVRDLLLFDVT